MAWAITHDRYHSPVKHIVYVSDSKLSTNNNPFAIFHDLDSELGLVVLISYSRLAYGLAS